ncbi:hypothetical protein ACM66B_003025 [Microbotryomycetes sp. NB124-2]
MDERAAKAARAKEKLKRFQAAKNSQAATQPATAQLQSATTAAPAPAATTVSSPPVPQPLSLPTTPLSPPARIVSPLPFGIPPPPRAKPQQQHQAVERISSPPTSSTTRHTPQRRFHAPPWSSQQHHASAASAEASTSNSSRPSSFELERTAKSPPPRRATPLASQSSMPQSPLRASDAVHSTARPQHAQDRNATATINGEHQAQLVDSQQQTIQLLVSDKERLAARVRELEHEPTRQQTAATAGNAVATATRDSSREMAEHRLQVESKNREEQLNRLEREYEVSRHSVQELKNELVSKDKTLEDVQAQLNELQNSNNSSALESKLRSARDRVDMLELELSKARTSSTKLATEKDDVFAQLSAVQTAQENASAEVETAREQIAQLQSQLQHLQHESTTSSKTSSEQSRLVAELKASLAAAQADLTTAQTESSQAKTKLTMAQQALDASESKSQSTASRTDSLQAENTGLVAALEELRGKVVSLSNDNASLQDQVAGLRRTIKDKDAIIAVASSESDGETSRLRRDLDELKRRQDDASLLRQKLETVQQRAKEAENQKAQTSQRLETLEGELSDVREQHQAERDSRLETEQELEQVKEQLQGLERQLQAAQSSDTSTLTRLQQLETEVDEVRRQKNDLDKSLTTARAELAQAREQHLVQLSELQANVEGLTSSQTTHASRAETLAAQLAEMETLKATHETTIAGLRAEVQDGDEMHAAALRELQGQVDEARQASLEKQSELDELKTKLAQFETDHHTSTESTEALKEELKALQEQYDELLTQHEEALDQIATETNALEQHAAELERLRGQLSSATIRADALEKQHAAVQHNLAGVKKQHEETIGLLEQARTQQVEAQEWRRELDTSREEAARLQQIEQQVVELMAVAEDSRAQVAALEKERDSARAELEQARQTIDGLQAKLDDSQAQTAELQQLQVDLNKAHARSTALEAELSQAQTQIKETAEKPSQVVYQGAEEAQKRIEELEAQLVQSRAAADLAQSNIASQISTIQKMRNDHKKMVETTTAHSRRVEELGKIIEKKDYDASRLAAEIAKVKIENATVRAEAESVSRARRMGEQLLNTARATNSKLEAELSDLRSKLASSQSTASSLQQVLDSSESSADKSDVERARLREDLTSANARIKELEFSLDAVTQKAAASAAQVDDLTDALAALKSGRMHADEASQTETSRLRAELEEVRRLYATSTSEVEQLRSRAAEQARDDNVELVTLRDKVHSLERELQDAQSRLERSQASLKELEAERDSLTRASADENDAASAAALATRDRLQRELDQIRSELEESIAERRELESAFADSQVQAEERQAAAESAEAELERIKVAFEQRDASAHDVRVQLEQANARLSDLEAQLQSNQVLVDSQTSTADKIRAQLEERVEVLESTVRDKDAALAQLESSLGQEIEFARKAAHERTRQASKSERELQAIIASGDERAGEIDRLRGNVESLESEVANLRTKAEGSTVEVQSLTSELQRTVQELEGLKQTLDNERQMLAQARSGLDHAQGSLNAKSNEIDQLKLQLAGSQGGDQAGASPYDREYVDSIQQQHELEQSAARAQIRSLEERVFAAEETRHEMLKANGDLKSQIESLEAVLRRERAALRGSRSVPYSVDGRAPELDEEHEDDDDDDDEGHRHHYDEDEHLPGHDHFEYDQPETRDDAVTRSQFSSETASDPSSSVVSTPTRSSNHNRRFSHRRAPSTLATVDENADPSSLEFPFTQPPTSNATAYPSILSPPLVPVATSVVGGEATDSDPSLSTNGGRRSSRHVRKASLSLLKQRMQSELGVDDLKIVGREDGDEFEVAAMARLNRMSLEATMLVLDNSSSSINGDYTPTRLEAQVDAVHVIFNQKLRAHPENEVGLIVMGGKAEVLVTPTQDEGKLIAALHETKQGGDADLSTGIQVAQLALKHRQNKNQRQRIIVFVGSPLSVSAANLVKLGKKMKKNNVAIDIVSFGTDTTAVDLTIPGSSSTSTATSPPETNEQKLTALHEAVNSSDNSHYLFIEPGPHLLSERINQSAILRGDRAGDGDEAMGGETDEFGVDPNLDPELAMALRMSLEEERARQAAQSGASGSAAPTLDTVAESIGASEPAAAATGPAASTSTDSASTAEAKTETTTAAFDKDTAAALAAAAAAVRPGDASASEDVGMAEAGAGANDDEDDDLARALALSRGEDVDMGDSEEDDDIARAIALSMQQDEQSNEDKKE